MSPKSENFSLYSMHADGFSLHFLQSGTGLFRDFHNKPAILADLVFILTILIKWANFSEFAMPGIG